MDEVKKEAYGGKPREGLKDSDFVLPGERAFPVMTPKDVKDAVSSWGRYKGKATFTSFKRRLMALCKRKGEKFTAALPDTWKAEQKAVNIGENVEKVRHAFYEAFRPMVPAYSDALPTVFWNLDDDDIWDEYVIGCKREGGGETYWRIPYTVAADGAITFAAESEWQAVEEVWQEVAAEEPAAVASVDTDTLIAMGGPIKSLSNGHLGGYLVVFSDPLSPDLTGDYFDQKTDFGFSDTVKSISAHVWLHHRQPLKTRDGGAIQVKERIGTATLTKDDHGVLIDAILFNRAQYEAALTKMGWSSGTASHLVEREQKGASWHVTQWLLGDDASMTPSPAEPRTQVIPLKAFSADPLDVKAFEPEADAELPAADATKSAAEKTEVSESHVEVFTMNDEEKKYIADTVAAGVAAALPSATEAAVKAILEKLPAQSGGIAANAKMTDLAAERPFKSLGEQLREVFVATKSPMATDKRLLALNEKYVGFLKATGINEANPSEGGYLVQPEFSQRWIERMYTTGAVMSRVQRTPVTGNMLTMWGVDETSRVDGARFGGILGYWMDEAAALTPTKPKFRKVTMTLKKEGVLYYATDEQIADTPALSARVDRMVSSEIKFIAERAIIEGPGSTGPLGVMNAPALITASKEVGQGADTIVYENFLKMWTRMDAASRPNAVWYINQDVEPQLYTMNLKVGTGGAPVFMPAGGASAAPYATFFGRPVIPIEYCQTLGDKGDVLLADLGQYETIDKGGDGIQYASSMHVEFLTDLMAYRFIFRIDGQPSWHSAVTPLHGSNTVSPFVTLEAR